MTYELKEILKRLEKAGIFLPPKSIKAHSNQGLMSKVYVADSNIGPVIIHITKTNTEQELQKSWQKIHALGDLLKSFPDIFNADVILSGRLGKSHFLVQRFLKGQAAGARVLRNLKVVDVWKKYSPEIERQIEKQIAEIHKIRMKGAGWLFLNKGELRGKYPSWQKFLDSEMAFRLKGIRYKEKSSWLADKIRAYYLSERKKISGNYSALVHDDVINPGNILLDGKKLVGIVDWEWALSGDPAWEFSFNNRYGLKTYFKLRGYSLKQQQDFRERAKIYEIIYLAFNLYAHRLDKSQALYRHIRNHLVEMLQSY